MDINPATSSPEFRKYKTPHNMLSSSHPLNPKQTNARRKPARMKKNVQYGIVKVETDSNI